MTVEDYRKNKDTAIYAERFKSEYPQHFEFINELQHKYYKEDSKEVTMGVTYDIYRNLSRLILNKRPKHIIEYGSGFTTAYIERVIEELDYKPTFVSYEHIPYYFDKAKEMGLDPHNCMELVDMTIEDRDGFYYCTYIHDLEKHRDVDLVFIDGPGIVVVDEVRKQNINLNLEVLVNEFDKKINYLIDGRHNTQAYYRELYTNKFGEK